ncbi:hypothetical protein, partial [Pseudomonas viridiflava]|uniref:hypothetical protein n=1 Tax=Pseudomonas viridiflava TaxID=33069 RepID=UPI001980286F
GPELFADTAGIARSGIEPFIGNKPPDRKALAAQMLTEADVPELSWEEPVSADHWSVLQNCGFTVAASYSIDHLTAVGQPQATVIQLVMMGEV